MTRKYLVIFLGYAVVLLVLRSVVAEDCSQDISNENCTLTTHNNEIESLSLPQTHEVTTHTPELMTTLRTPTEESVETTIRPIESDSSSTTLTSTSTSTEASMSNTTDSLMLNSTEVPVSNSTETESSNSTEIPTSNSTEASASNAIEVPTSNTTEIPTTTSTEVATSNSAEVPTSNSTEVSISNSTETPTSNSTDLPISDSTEVPRARSIDIPLSNSMENPSANSTEITTSHVVEVPTPTIVEIATEPPIVHTTDAPTPNSTEVLPLESTGGSISNSVESSTSNLMENPSSLENSTSNPSESPVGNSLETATSNLVDITTLNPSETSTSMENTFRPVVFPMPSTSNITESATLNSMEISTSNSVETSSNSSEVTTNSSETTMSNAMETTTLKPSESSTSHIMELTTTNSIESSSLMEISTSKSSDDSTSNFIDSSTETSIDHSADSSTDHLMETSTDMPTTENLTESSTENPTESALHDETTTFATTNAVDEPKGRALNFSVEEENPNNVLSNMSNHHYDDDDDDDDSDMSDRTIHDDDNFNLDVDSLDPKILAPKNQIHNFSLSVCEKGGLTYENGEKLELGCESVCTCRDGKMDCTDRCTGPYFRRGKKIDDPLCSAKEVDDPCCSILVCAGDTETEPLEMCSYENKTYNRGDTFDKGCTEACTCEAAGKISCKPRCPLIAKTSDRCVEVPDPNDFCCLKVLCDVTLDEHDTEKEEEKGKPKLLAARYVNMTAILLTFDSHMKFDDHENQPIVEVSNDKDDWKYYKLLPGGIVFVKNRFKYLKIENTDDVVEIEDSELASPEEPESNADSDADLALQFDHAHDLQFSVTSTENSVHCFYKNRMFKDGEEYNDECESLCRCQKGEMKCLKMQCPTYFGVDVLDPSCIEWETIPPDFVPSPPNCCPEKVHCKNNGSCEYEGIMYKNWDLIPSNITGCERKCYCEMGTVECQNICPPVTALPPPTLDCPPSLAMVGHVPDDDCCKYWICKPETHTPETVHSQSESDVKGQTPHNSTDDDMGPFAPKTPSKVLGPLAVYANEDNDQAVVNNSLGVRHKSKINPNENPFYHKKQSPQSPHKSSASKPASPKEKFNDHLDTPYLGPFNPNSDKTISKPTKDTRNKITNKDNSVFVTTPANTFADNVYHEQEHYLPNYYNPSPPGSAYDNSPHVNIHSHSSPEEILQFIHQHPEIGNYPSGSVLEIHNAVPGNNVQQQFVNQGLQTVTKPKIHLVPYIVPQTADGQPIHDNLPPGLSLEEILREFQKNSQALQNNPLAFLPPPQHSVNNGPVLHPMQNGLLIHNKHNATNPGNDGQILPEPYPGLPGQQPQDEIIIQSLEAEDPHKVRLAFTVPHIIVGLHGRFEVRYTHNKDESDLDSWMLTVFAPPNDLIATPSLEFDLTDLKADTEYSIKITVTLRDLHNMPTSKVYKIRTPKEAAPPVIPIDPDLAITDINATWVTVVWRAFTQYELQFIDGIQLRYKEIDGRIYTATPLVHRAVTRYTLENLKSNTKYEIGIYFIPFPGQMTELRTENMLHFTTANEIDTYGFNVTLEISQIKSQTVEISWNGVPYPEDKYVNIYRAIYQSDSGKEDQSTFKIAKRDSPTKTIIRDLKPGTRYRLWLEVYLTNGKIKTSNVEDFITKPRVAPALGSSTQQDKLSRAEVLESKGDYYGPLVIVAILAAIAILSTLILLLILVRRHNQNKAAITPPSTRISQSAYDNPTYKVEIQQETMGL